MKIRTARAALVAALKTCTAVADTRSTMPALACVRLTARGAKLTVAATDLNVSVTVDLVCAGDPGGDVLVSAAALARAVERMSGDEVTLEASGKTSTIAVKAGRATATEPTLSAREFPKIPEAPSTMAHLDSDALAEVIEACATATCTDETRFHLNGVLLELPGDRILGVATDGHRLHVRAIAGSTAIQSTRGVIVPRRALAVIERLLADTVKIEVALAGPNLFVRGCTPTPVAIVAKLIDATFPPYEAVIPQEAPKKLTAIVHTAPLLEAVKRVALATSDARGVNLDTKDGELHITASNGDRSASDVVDAETGPGKLGCCASAKYLIDAIEAVGTERIALYSGGELDPLLFAPAGTDPTTAGGRLAVVMPMRR